MPKCKGITKSGKRCKANTIRGDHCRWHTVNVDDTIGCVVCLESIEEPALPCGHWIHRECVQKHADAMQEVRAQEGYPPLTEGLCSLCRAPVPEVVPKTPPPASTPSIFQYVVSLTQNEIYTIYCAWLTPAGVRLPLILYIICQLQGKYPDHPSEVLFVFAQFYTDLIYNGHLNPSPPLPNRTFHQRLAHEW